MVFVFLARYLLDMASQKIWSKFTYSDYRINKRAFKRYMEKDDIIMKRSRKYRKLPVLNATVVAKRKNTGYSSFSEDSPVKRRCTLADNTTSEEED